MPAPGTVPPPSQRAVKASREGKLGLLFWVLHCGFMYMVMGQMMGRQMNCLWLAFDVYL